LFIRLAVWFGYGKGEGVAIRPATVAAFRPLALKKQ
jgi:hypothetical protein